MANEMKFTKMQGIGNDYVYVNCLEETVENPGEVARKVSDRHFGIGSDGLILIKPSLEADFEMDMYNSTVLRERCAEMGSAAWQSMFMTMDLQIKMKSALRQRAASNT